MPVSFAQIAGPVAAGAAFGAAMTASRVYLPAVIIEQMRFSDFHMLEVFLTAAASSALIIHGLDKLGIAKKPLRSNSTLNWFSKYDGNILGGALLGLGMSLTGSCPGSVLPQLALGVPSSAVTALGGVLGGLVYARYGKALCRAPRSAEAKVEVESHSIADKLQIPTETVLLAFEIIMLAGVGLSSIGLPGKSETAISTINGGVLIGLSQAISLVLTSSPLGISGAYEQTGQYIWRALGSTSVSKPSSPPRPIIFAIGAVAGSLGAGQFYPVGESVHNLVIPVAQGLLGGFLLIFGARLAGGCTSGHGLSGLSALSYSSLITTAAMFAGGAAFQLL